MTFVGIYRESFSSFQLHSEIAAAVVLWILQPSTLVQAFSFRPQSAFSAFWTRRIDSTFSSASRAPVAHVQRAPRAGHRLREHPLQPTRPRQEAGAQNSKKGSSSCCLSLKPSKRGANSKKRTPSGGWFSRKFSQTRVEPFSRQTREVRQGFPPPQNGRAGLAAPGGFQAVGHLWEYQIISDQQVRSDHWWQVG